MFRWPQTPTHRQDDRLVRCMAHYVYRNLLIQDSTTASTSKLARDYMCRPRVALLMINNIALWQWYCKLNDNKSEEIIRQSLYILGSIVNFVLAINTYKLLSLAQWWEVALAFLENDNFRDRLVHCLSGRDWLKTVLKNALTKWTGDYIITPRIELALLIVTDFQETLGKANKDDLVAIQNNMQSLLEESQYTDFQKAQLMTIDLVLTDLIKAKNQDVNALSPSP